jgi:glycosyltransferase involved in cell wall biosynthesis
MIPLVSFIMSMRNNQSTILSAIKSIQLQTCSDWELILANDGCSDSSGQIVTGLNDPRIKIIGDQNTKGLAARLNDCLQYSKGQFIARMDADDICLPSRIETQARHLRENPQVDLTASSGLVFNNSGFIIGVLPIQSKHQSICSQPWAGFPLAHPTWMAKAAWLKAHRYNEQFIKAQDQELLLRTYKKSVFSGQNTELIGYRQSKLSYKKLAIGRYYFAKALINNRETVGIPGITMGISLQFSKSLADIYRVHKQGRGVSSCIHASHSSKLWEKTWEACTRKGEA